MDDERERRGPSLILDSVSKRYGQGAYVLEGLSCRFEPGTATGLVGPNGSGKTTLLRLLSVLAYPTAGRITYGDLDIHVFPYRYLQHTGIVHDSGDLPQYLSGMELLEYVVRARRGWDEAAPRRIGALFDRLLLDERRDNLIGTYSSGMLKKTQIALALVVGPSVLLMDEPFRGLDEASTEAVLELLQGFRQAGGLLILSSHIRETLEPLCDHYIRFQARPGQRPEVR